MRTRDAHLVTHVRMHPAVEIDSDHKLGVVTFWHPRRHSPCGPGPEAMTDKPLERINIATLREETVERSFVDVALARLQEAEAEPKDIAGIVREAAVDTVGNIRVGLSCPGTLPCPCSAPRTKDC